MSDLNASRASSGFTPLRFGLLLALLIFAAFPQVLLGLQTFVIRDYGFFSYPAALFQQQCFWRGELPFWNPYNYCGVPFLAQWNTMPLYPPALIYLLLPLTWSLSFFCLLHLWFAGFGMFLLARRWTGNNFAAAFAGVVFAFNGLTLNLLMWPSHIATLSWMPWVVLAVETGWREGGRKIIIAALVGALQMLAGGPETILFTWLFLLVLWLQQFATGKTPRSKMLWRFPTIVVVVILLAAIQLLPFLDLAAHSQRETGFADTRWSLPASGWANFIVPMVFGSTRDMGVFFQYGQNWTSSYYPGIGTLWLALLAVWSLRQKRVWLAAGCALVALLFAYGDHTPVYPALRRLIPQLSLITYPVKYLTPVTFLLPLLAAFTLARVENLPDAQKRIFTRRTMLVGIILLALIVGILVWAWRSPFPGDDVHATLLNGLVRGLFLLLTGSALIVLLKPVKANLRRAALIAFILLAWLDVLTHEPPQNPTVPPSVYTPNDARAKLAMNPQPELGQSRAMLSPMAEYVFVHSAITNAKNNFLIGRLCYGANCNLLDAVPKVDGFFSLAPRGIDTVLFAFYSWTNADHAGLEDFMGVSQISATGQIYHWQSRPNFLPLVTAGQKPVFLDDADALIALTQPDFNGRKSVFLPPEAKPLVTVSNQTSAKILNSKFDNQTVVADVEAAEPSLVVVAQSYYHNWQAEVDGRSVPLLRANVGFQAVQVPAGRHHLQLDYNDGAFGIGEVISFVAWAVCLVLLVRPPRKEPG